MTRLVYSVPELDCPSEEQMIRMALGELDGVASIRVDIPGRAVTVLTDDDPDRVTAAMEGVGLGAVEQTREAGVAPPGAEEDAPSERGPLVGALVINLAFFIGELVAGWLSGSMGLVADSLDMLADAVVYGLSLAAVGGALSRKRALAAASGWMQLALACLGLVEVVRRFVTPQQAPEVWTMVVVSALALAGNVATMALLRRAPRGEVHVEASWIFTSNDVKANLLVILAGGLVALTASRVPDLVAGTLIFIIVATGARRILRMARG